MKKWTHRDARSGNTVSPDGFNDEFRAQQSSITTIDRDQIPASFVDEARLEPGAILRTYADDQYPAASDGQQDADADTSVASNMWIASTFQVHAGGWTNVGSTITLSNFGGGSLFFEWSCNAYVSNIFARGANDGFPGSPAYMRLRILVNGVTLAERRGTAYHEHSRLFGTSIFAPGDLSVDLQFRLTEPSEDCAWSLPSGDNLLQAHIYSSRYFAVGRFR